jgi:hypothetical protein
MGGTAVGLELLKYSSVSNEIPLKNAITVLNLALSIAL